MMYFSGYREAKNSLRGATIAIGNFDGVHLGHQKLLSSVKEISGKSGGLSAAYSFSPHPAKVLSPSTAPSLIMSDRQKVDIIAKFGIQIMIVERFSISFSKMSATSFINDVLVDSLGVSAVVIGENYRFGYGAEGDAELLEQGLQPFGIEVRIVKPVFIEGELCSSSRIRSLVENGEVDKAARFLGRYFCLHGNVVAGAGRGRRIRIQTANLRPQEELMPGNGVYATLVFLDNETYVGATNVGYRPTFEVQRCLSIETHLLGFEGSIYGKHLKLAFLQKIREEKKFGSAKALADQIKNDIQAVQKIGSRSLIQSTK